jgi:hypothetical protein
MFVKDIRVKARDLGVKNYSKMSKVDLIHAIQEQEGNDSCYQNIVDCGIYDCCWRSDCQS